MQKKAAERCSDSKCYFESFPASFIEMEETCFEAICTERSARTKRQELFTPNRCKSQVAARIKQTQKSPQGNNDPFSLEKIAE